MTSEAEYGEMKLLHKLLEEISVGSVGVLVAWQEVQLEAIRGYRKNIPKEMPLVPRKIRQLVDAALGSWQEVMSHQFDILRETQSRRMLEEELGAKAKFVNGQVRSEGVDKEVFINGRWYLVDMTRSRPA